MQVLRYCDKCGEIFLNSISGSAIWSNNDARRKSLHFIPVQSEIFQIRRSQLKYSQHLINIPLTVIVRRIQMLGKKKQIKAKITFQNFCLHPKCKCCCSQPVECQSSLVHRSTISILKTMYFSVNTIGNSENNLLSDRLSIKPPLSESFTSDVGYTLEYPTFAVSFSFVIKLPCSFNIF